MRRFAIRFYNKCGYPVGIPLSVDMIEHRGEPRRKPIRNQEKVEKGLNIYIWHKVKSRSST